MADIHGSPSAHLKTAEGEGFLPEMDPVMTGVRFMLAILSVPDNAARATNE
jgi:hypothetical protein